MGIQDDIRACQAGELLGRYKLARKAGLTFAGDRDLFGALGYKQTPVYADFAAQYQTSELAQRVIDAYPDETWGNPPEVYDNEDEGIETPFEKAFEQLVKDFNLWGILNRADKLTGLGLYSALLLGLSGAEPMETEASGARKLLYLQPYSEATAVILDYEMNPALPRYGQPNSYTITTIAGLTQRSFTCHFSRILHLVEGSLDNTLFGKPRLQAIYNRIDDITKVVGGSAEMFWRAAFKGLHVNVDKDVALTNPTESLADLKESMEEYSHNLSRIIRTQGVDIKSLTGETADPTGIFTVAVQLISCASGIPLRILLGSERGELASSQDTQEWNGRIARRMQTHASPNILRPLIDRFIAFGILPKPQGGEYEIEWPDVTALKDSERATIALTLAQAANTLAPGAGETVLTREEWRVAAGFPAKPKGGFDDALPEDELGELNPTKEPPVQ